MEYSIKPKRFGRKENNPLPSKEDNWIIRDIMATQCKLYITASELAELLGISVGHAYKIIKKLNVELEKEGYLIIAGKVPRGYFEKRWYGFKSA